MAKWPLTGKIKKDRSLFSGGASPYKDKARLKLRRNEKLARYVAPTYSSIFIDLLSGSISVSLGKPIPAETRNEKY